MGNDDRHEFEQALEHLVEQYRDRIGDDTVLEILREQLQSFGEDAEAAPSLDPGPAAPSDQSESARDDVTPDPETEYSPASEELVLTFRSGDALAAQVEEIAASGGMMVSVDEVPPAMTEIDIVIRVEGRDETTRLSGRLVSQSGDLAGLQFDLPVARVEQEFEALLESLRGRPADRRATRVDLSEPDARPTQETEARFGPATAASNAETSPSVSVTTDRPPDSEWDLDDTPLSRVLADMADRAGPGIAEVKLADDSAELLMSSGDLFEIRRASDGDPAPIGDLLLAAGYITDEQLDRARGISESRGLSISEALQHTDALPYQKLQYGMKSRVVMMLEDLLDVDARHASYYAVDRLPENYTHPPVSLATRMFRSIYEDLETRSSSQLEEYRRRFQRARIRRVDESDFPFDRLDLGTYQRRFVERSLESSTHFDELMRATTINRNGVIRLLAALDRVGALVVEELEEGHRRDQQARQRLDNLERQTDSDDPFAVVGLSWTAYGELVEEAVDELERELDSLDERLGGEVADRTDAVRARASSAEDEISEPEGRRNYRDRHVADSDIDKRISMLEDQIDSLRMKKDVDELVDRCKRMLEIAPGHDLAQELLRELGEYGR